MNRLGGLDDFEAVLLRVRIRKAAMTPLPTTYRASRVAVCDVALVASVACAGVRASRRVTGRPAPDLCVGAAILELN